MSLKCIAIDDEPLALDLIKSYCSKIQGLDLILTFEDAIAGSEYLDQNPVDLLFIDINMPDISGIDLVKSLSVRPMVIFTTAYKNFAYEGFELEALDYLLKPVDFTRFAKAAQKAIEQQNFKTSASVNKHDSLFVYSEYRLVRIPFQDIIYIESLEDYIRIHIASGKPILTLLPLKKVLEKLPSSFRRIHRSFIVSVSRVQSIHNRKLTLDTGIEVPVSETYASFITEWTKGKI
jgi:two-component system, LytTR family, response regulator